MSASCEESPGVEHVLKTMTNHAMGFETEGSCPD